MCYPPLPHHTAAAMSAGIMLRWIAREAASKLLPLGRTPTASTTLSVSDGCSKAAGYSTAIGSWNLAGPSAKTTSLTRASMGDLGVASIAMGGMRRWHADAVRRFAPRDEGAVHRLVRSRCGPPPALIPYRRMLSDATKTNATVGAQSNSVTGKFKELFRKYGALFVVFYGGLYLTTLGGMYVCFEYNVFSKATKKKIVELQETYAEFIKKVSATQPRRAKYKRPPHRPLQWRTGKERD